VLKKNTLGNLIPLCTRDLVALVVVVACTDMGCSAIASLDCGIWAVARTSFGS